ncbi:uncharacterized protein BJ171DRAFT_154542 [Polychytrium aggregatum]|uniref:uncharacterized protein n=1 Tax=Polychytrium aggregatum TaxID=110093 RepID=UPI0022FF2716|nr:uncharacterized protein BJ171DRAFT_154542 [Polychytrium aggregatum]KAI9203191.1 hypothetical protein BJ171DRAFT_154542 [Polychytrium aggregatum]
MTTPEEQTIVELLNERNRLLLELKTKNPTILPSVLGSSWFQDGSAGQRESSLSRRSSVHSMDMSPLQPQRTDYQLQPPPNQAQFTVPPPPPQAGSVPFWPPAGVLAPRAQGTFLIHSAGSSTSGVTLEAIPTPYLVSGHESLDRHPHAHLRQLPPDYSSHRYSYPIAGDLAYSPYSSPNQRASIWPPQYAVSDSGVETGNYIVATDSQKSQSLSPSPESPLVTDTSLEIRDASSSDRGELRSSRLAHPKESSTSTARKRRDAEHLRRITLNNGFSELAKLLPNIDDRNPTKLMILRKACEYIMDLEDRLREQNASTSDSQISKAK